MIVNLSSMNNIIAFDKVNILRHSAAKVPNFLLCLHQCTCDRILIPFAFLAFDVSITLFQVMFRISSSNASYQKDVV